MTFEFKAQHDGFVRSYLKNIPESPLGPIVGKLRNDGSIDLDVEGFAGEYANEILQGVPVQQQHSVVQVGYENRSLHYNTCSALQHQSNSGSNSSTPCSDSTQTASRDKKKSERNSLEIDNNNTKRTLLPKDALSKIAAGEVVHWQAFSDGRKRDQLKELCDAVKVLEKLSLSRANHGQDPNIRSDKIGFVSLNHTENQLSKNNLASKPSPALIASKPATSTTASVLDDPEFSLEDDDESQICKAEMTLLLGYSILEACAFEAQAQVGKLIRPPTGMVAVYPASGTKYVSHLDNARDDDGHLSNYRLLTALLYLSDGPEWQTEDGGLLKWTDPLGQSQEVIPRAGTIVLFDSTKVHHEVTPTSRRRAAISLWFSSMSHVHDPKPPRGLRLAPPKKRKTTQKKSGNSFVIKSATRNTLQTDDGALGTSDITPTWSSNPIDVDPEADKSFSFSFF